MPVSQVVSLDCANQHWVIHLRSRRAEAAFYSCLGDDDDDDKEDDDDGDDDDEDDDEDDDDDN